MSSSEKSSRPIALGLLFVCFLALGVGFFNAVSAPKDASKPSTHSDRSLGVSKLLKKSQAHLAFMELSGMITMGDESDAGIFSQESNAMSVRKALDEAAKDDAIKGVLLRINSPGGTVAMSQELNAAVKRVSLKKPVVVSMGDLTASGGYYTACAADKIVANAGTLTASIGVIISTMNLSELFNKKLGIHAVTIKSGRFKDILSPYRKPTSADLQLIQTLINNSYQDFLNTVIEGRTRFIQDATEKKQRIAKLKAVADGRIVTGRQALDAGLVDVIGDQDAAYTLLDKMAKKKFKIHSKDRLPLDSTGKHFDIGDWIGLNSESLANVLGKVSGAPSLPVLPASVRYPNQPLWIME